MNFVRFGAACVLFSAIGLQTAVASAQSAAAAVQFADLVRRGDRHRLAGNLSDAMRLYDQALTIRADPAVEGRIGLIMLEADQPATAARYLLNAIVQGGAPPGLMAQFHQAFARVRPRLCYVDVYASELGADVTIDGEDQADSSQGRFYVFVLPGKHVLRAKLEGFETAVETIEAEAGGRLSVSLKLQAIPPPQVEKAPEPRPAPSSEAPRTAPPVMTLPAPSSSWTFSLGAGAVFVAGAAPGGAVGPQIFSAWRRGWFSVGLEGRAAWALEEPEGFPEVRLVSWALGAAPCAHWRASPHASLFGCTLVQADWLAQTPFSGGTTFIERFAPRLGLGLRGGLEFVLHERMRVLLSGDAVVRSGGQQVTAAGEQPFWRGSAVLGSFGAGAMVTF